MARYSLATALISLSIANAAHGHEKGEESWAYLPVKLPTSLSDMSIVPLLVVSEGDAVVTSTEGGDVHEGHDQGEDDTDGDSGLSDRRRRRQLDHPKTRFIITGGCDSELGNEYQEWGEESWFECKSLTAKVCFIMLVVGIMTKSMFVACVCVCLMCI